METHKQFKPPQIETFNPVDTVMGETANSATELYLPKNLRVKEAFVTTDTDVNMRRGQIVNRIATALNYSAATTDYLISVTSIPVARSIGLPRPKDVGIGKTYIVKDEVGGAATTTITVRSAAEETIDGATTSTLTTNYQSRRYYSDGANWFTF